jgi:exonuclease-1
LTWCINRCNLLIHFEVTPIIIFDGGRLPEKEGTETKRRESRHKYKELALVQLQAGNRDAATKLFQKSIEINETMLRTFIEKLRSLNIEFIVAPYEADAQLCYLAQTDYIQSVITEDSDLLCFGCPHVFYKMDSDGSGREISLSLLELNTDLSFRGWTHTMFQCMCILSGCDYLDSLPSIGIKKAHAIVQHAQIPQRIIQKIRLDAKSVVPPSYESDFEKALLTFKHQRVYDPIQKKIVHLTEPSPETNTKYSNLDFLGA